MFTGIITATAEVLSAEKNPRGLALKVVRPKNWTDLQAGESINSDGVCLTVESQDAASYSYQLVPETLAKTTFGQSVPKAINLERSLQTSDRFGGHFVQGHVDTVGTVKELVQSKGEVRLVIGFDAKYRQLVVDKGSITVNGVALTVTETKDNSFGVALIPYTLEHTNLGSLTKGSLVNLEFDVIGKYIVKALKPYANS